MSDLFDSRPLVDRPAPDDAVSGPDPAVTITEREVTLFAYVCGECDYEAIGSADAMKGHVRFAHPASRNPDLTCQAEHIAIGGWCVRPKGHEGDHWAPTFNEGGMWWS